MGLSGISGLSGLGGVVDSAAAASPIGFSSDSFTQGVRAVSSHIWELTYPQTATGTFDLLFTWGDREEFTIDFGGATGVFTVDNGTNTVNINPSTDDSSGAIQALFDAQLGSDKVLVSGGSGSYSVSYNQDGNKPDWSVTSSTDGTPGVTITQQGTDDTHGGTASGLAANISEAAMVTALNAAWGTSQIAGYTTKTNSGGITTIHLNLDGTSLPYGSTHTATSHLLN